MNSRDFAYWLKGAIEVGNIETLTAAQVARIQNEIDHIEDNPSEFVSYAKGVLAIFKTAGTDNPDLLKASFDSLRVSLEDQFGRGIEESRPSQRRRRDRGNDPDVELLC